MYYQLSRLYVVVTLPTYTVPTKYPIKNVVQYLECCSLYVQRVDNILNPPEKEVCFINATICHIDISAVVLLKYVHMLEIV